MVVWGGERGGVWMRWGLGFVEGRGRMGRILGWLWWWWWWGWSRGEGGRGGGDGGGGDGCGGRRPLDVVRGGSTE